MCGVRVCVCALVILSPEYTMLSISLPFAPIFSASGCCYDGGNEGGGGGGGRDPPLTVDSGRSISVGCEVYGGSTREL